MSHGKPKEIENLKEEVMPTVKKTKFGRKATKDDKSNYGSTEEIVEEMDLETIMISSLPDLFKSKEIEESLIEVEKEHSLTDEKHSKRVITIDSYRGNMAQKVIL